jgi:hypothetical protein
MSCRGWSAPRRRRVHFVPPTDAAPTILHLFGEENAPTLGLSPWDFAFLKALYSTEQKDKMQLSEIKTSVIQQVLH